MHQRRCISQNRATLNNRSGIMKPKTLESKLNFIRPQSWSCNPSGSRLIGPEPSATNLHSSTPWVSSRQIKQQKGANLATKKEHLIVWIISSRCVWTVLWLYLKTKERRVGIELDPLVPLYTGENRPISLVVYVCLKVLLRHYVLEEKN